MFKNFSLKEFGYTILVMFLSCGKFAKDIGSQMFFWTKLFGPILSASALGAGFGYGISALCVLGIVYTIYLTSYLSLKRKVFKKAGILTKQTETVVIEEPEELDIVPLLDNRIEVISPHVISNSEYYKNKACKFILVFVGTARGFFVISDTYLGINKLLVEIAELFDKTIPPKTLNILTNYPGSYFAASDGIMYGVYAYKLTIKNGELLRKNLSWENFIKFKNETLSNKGYDIAKVAFASAITACGIGTKAINDCYKISTSMQYVPFIKLLPASAFPILGYIGAITSIFSKSLSEGGELFRVAYHPIEFLKSIRTLTRESKMTYLKLFAFLLDSATRAASGYLAVQSLGEQFGIDNNTAQIPVGTFVAVCIASLQFTFDVRSLQDNAKARRELVNTLRPQPEPVRFLGYLSSSDEDLNLVTSAIRRGRIQRP